MSFARIQSGAVVELFDALPVFTPELMASVHRCSPDVAIGWTFDGFGYAAPAAPAIPAPQTIIPSLTFVDRFTPAEQVAIMTAAAASPALNLWLLKATAAQTVDLAAPATAAGLDALVGAGLISADRKAQILTP